KPRALEVFSREGAAVLGQHLGEKIIVARELIDEGFDAIASTMLHELSHEAGGEESATFHARLTRLIGAALARPDRVVAARAHYAAVTESDALPIVTVNEEVPEAAPYAPERRIRDLRQGNERGAFCELVIADAF